MRKITDEETTKIAYDCGFLNGFEAAFNHANKMLNENHGQFDTSLTKLILASLIGILEEAQNA